MVPNKHSPAGREEGRRKRRATSQLGRSHGSPRQPIPALLPSKPTGSLESFIVKALVVDPLTFKRNLFDNPDLNQFPHFTAGKGKGRGFLASDTAGY